MNDPILSMAPDTPRSEESNTTPSATKKTKRRKLIVLRLRNPSSTEFINYPFPWLRVFHYLRVMS